MQASTPALPQALLDDLPRRHARLRAALAPLEADSLILALNVDLIYASGTVMNGWFYMPATGTPVFYYRRPSDFGDWLPGFETVPWSLCCGNVQLWSPSTSTVLERVPSATVIFRVLESMMCSPKTFLDAKNPLLAANAESRVICSAESAMVLVWLENSRVNVACPLVWTFRVHALRKV